MHKTMLWQPRLLVLGLVLAMSLGVAPAMAASQEASGAIIQSYNASAAVQIGMLVAPDAKDASSVVPLKSGQIKALLGVVIPANKAALTLTPEKIVQQQVLVARSGRYNLLVSDQNGTISVGDYLTLSAVSGVAMKADDEQAQVIGKAAAGFTGQTDVISSVTAKTSSGRSETVNIGRIPASIGIEANPLYQKTINYVPKLLSKVATTVANKQISAGRIYLCATILIIVAVITGSMLYSAIRNGMRAVGRNPLARKSILKSLIQTTIAGVIIFTTGVFAVYLLLKL